MRNHLVALLLLLVFGGSLFAGAHPCQFSGTASKSDKAMPDCHSSGTATASTTTHHGHGTPAPSEREDDGCSDEKGGCQHACHMVALVRFPVAVFAVESQERRDTPTVDRFLSLFAPPIDHIPLV